MVLMLEDNSIHTNSLNSYKLYNRNQYAFQEVSCFLSQDSISSLSQENCKKVFGRIFSEYVGVWVTATSQPIKQ